MRELKADEIEIRVKKVTEKGLNCPSLQNRQSGYGYP